MKNFITIFFLYTIIIVVILTLFLYYFYRPPDREPYPLPIFNTLTELNASTEWSEYIESVYLNKPSEGVSNFPFDMSDFSFLYKDILEESKITINPKMVSDVCYLQNKQNTLRESLVNWPDLDNNKYWLNKLPPFTCFEDGSYIEVIHSRGDPPNSGTWMYQATGSGIWYNVGNTTCFKKHNDAVRHFLGRDCDTSEDSVYDNKPDECLADFPELFSTAKAQGFDTVQFTEHGDQLCGLGATEIVDTSGNGVYSCGYNPDDADFDEKVAATFKTGFNHGISCVCNPDKKILNCDLSSA